MAIIVFDLDMTVVDSSHRHASKADGSIDLAHWFENCHRVADDTLLPLASRVEMLYNAGHKIVLCTSRCMQAADFAWLDAHWNELPHHALYYRQGRFVEKHSPEYANSYHGFIGDTRSDEEIKLEQMQEYIESQGFKTFEQANLIIFEDNLKTIAAFNERGAIGINAAIYNDCLKRGVA